MLCLELHHCQRKTSHSSLRQLESMLRRRQPRTFFDFLMVTRETPGTGFMPSFCIAFRDFFSLRLCFPRIDPSPARWRCTQRQQPACTHPHNMFFHSAYGRWPPTSVFRASAAGMDATSTHACGSASGRRPPSCLIACRRSCTSFSVLLSLLIVADVGILLLLLHLLRMQCAQKPSLRAVGSSGALHHIRWHVAAAAAVSIAELRTPAE